MSVDPFDGAAAFDPGASSAALAMAAVLGMLAGRPLAFAGAARPVSEAALDEACTLLGADAATLWAVLNVETRGCGFLPDRRPCILFERHHFSRRTGGISDRLVPELSNREPGGYVWGAAEYGRLEAAMVLDRRAALESTSWGLGQVMGFNARAAGFGDVDAFVQASVESEDAQLKALAAFMAAQGLDKPLRERRWSAFAQGYNGSGFARHQYDVKLEAAHARIVHDGPPDLRVRTAQLGLLLLNYAGNGFVDGRYGEKTRAALRRFQSDEGLSPVDGALNEPTLQRIRERVRWA